MKTKQFCFLFFCPPFFVNMNARELQGTLIHGLRLFFIVMVNTFFFVVSEGAWRRTHDRAAQIHRSA